MYLCSDNAIFSHRVTSKLVNDNTEAFYRMSKLYYELGEEEDSLRLDKLHAWVQNAIVIIAIPYDFKLT